MFLTLFLAWCLTRFGTMATRSINDSQPEWMSPVELANWLGIPVGTLYQWRHRGTGPPALKLGRHLRYRRSETERWLAKCGESQ